MNTSKILSDYLVSDPIIGGTVELPEAAYFYPAYSTCFSDISQSEKYCTEGTHLAHKKAKVLGVYTHIYSTSSLVALVKCDDVYAFVDRAQCIEI